MVHVRLDSLGMGLVLAAACSAPPEAAPPPGVLSGVLLVGCDELLADGEGWACGLERSDGEPVRVRVWIPAGPAARLQVDGAAIEPTRERASDDGTLLEVELRPGSEVLTVERGGAEPLQLLERWALRVHWRDPQREPLALDAEKASMFVAFAEGRWDDCRQQAERVRTLAREAGRGLTEWRALQNAILCAMEGGDAAAAKASSFELEQLPTVPDEREVTRAYVSGLVLLWQGALHESIITLRRGLELAERLGMTTRHAEHLSMLSLALAELGDVEGAVEAATAALDRQAHPHVHPCEDAALRANLAWVSMLGTEVGLAERVPDPEAEWLRALEAFEGAACTHEESAANVRLDLARAAMLRSDHAQAEHWLARAGKSVELAGGVNLRNELHLLRAQQALALGDLARAREALDRFRAPAHPPPADQALRRWILQGELAEREGDLVAAEACYRRAHALPLRRVGLVAHDEGRLRFIYDRLRGTQHLVALLAGPRGDPAGALEVAREVAGREGRLLAARHRALHGPPVDPALVTMRHEYLAVRDGVERKLEERWDLRPELRRDLRDRSRPHERARLDALLGAAPGSLEGEPGTTMPAGSEILRPPAPGELLLCYFPMPGGRRLAFAATADAVHTAWLAAPPEPLQPQGRAPERWRERWAEHLLEPFDAIDGAQRIRVLPSFGLESLPFHALPWRGRPLLVHAAVEHAVDLPGPAPSAPSEPRRALVVGDPRGDLAEARVEAEQVVEVLIGRGLRVDALLGSQAGGVAVRAALEHAQLLHYAGHAATAGPFGWESTLGLAGDGRLEVGDLFALERVPEQVVLTACRSGAQATGPRERGISLAEAFVLAGSRAVVAASIDLDAAEVSSLGALVHHAPDRAPDQDLAHAYRDAMLRWHEHTGTSATWQAMRLWVP